MKSIATIVSLILLTSCADKWSDHYAEDNSIEGTLWSAISQRAELSNFAKVVKATGYDSRLNSSQMFTVFAPTNDNFTEAEADQLVNRFLTERHRGTRDADNPVVRQFVQNHIALFNHSVSTLSNDSITMMNGKYEVLTNGLFGQSSISSSNQFCANGVLYTVDSPEPYFANVYEQLSQDGQTDSLYQFISSYSVYEFDPAESVAGDIVNGKTVYLDSVFHLSNSLLRTYGYINREDSLYMVVAPTDEVWQRLFNAYLPYFNYNDLTSKRDSMVLTHTRRAIADGTVFNINAQLALQDSAVSTHYQSLYRNKTSYDDPRYYLYQRPYDVGGAFSGAQETTCSNGRVLKQSQWNIDKHQTFLQQIKVEAEQSIYVDTIIQAREPLSIRTVPQTNAFYGKISGNNFVEAQPLSTASSTSVRYAIPDQLSNTGYDICCVFVPAIAYNSEASAEDRLPCRVRFTLTYQEQDGSVTTTTLRNPADNSVNYITTPDVVDTVLVASDYHFPTCALDLDNPQVTLRVACNMTSSMSSTYTRTLRLDCILLRPHKE